MDAVAINIKSTILFEFGSCIFDMLTMFDVEPASYFVALPQPPVNDFVFRHVNCCQLVRVVWLLIIHSVSFMAHECQCLRFIYKLSE